MASSASLDASSLQIRSQRPGRSSRVIGPSILNESVRGSWTAICGVDGGGCENSSVARAGPLRLRHLWTPSVSAPAADVTNLQRRDSNLGAALGKHVSKSLQIACPLPP